MFIIRGDTEWFRWVRSILCRYKVINLMLTNIVFNLTFYHCCVANYLNLPAKLVMNWKKGKITPSRHKFIGKWSFCKFYCLIELYNRLVELEMIVEHEKGNSSFATVEVRWIRHTYNGYRDRIGLDRVQALKPVLWNI